MLKQWHQLRHYPIFGFKGATFLKLRLTYLFLAITSPNLRDNAKNVDLKDSEGEVWSSFNKWLHFQTSYIHPKSWAKTPIIRGVTLVNLESIDSKYTNNMDANSRELIEEVAKVYSATFSGIKHTEYRNWVTRNFLLANSFTDSGLVPFEDSSPLVEIGPGLGSILTLATLSRPTRILSLDTFEMQNVFSALQNRFPDKYKKLVKFPVNSAEIPTLDKNSFNLFAFWSFTELKESERSKYLELIGKSRNAVIATNQTFEGIDNFKYLEDLAESLDKTLTHKNLSELLGSDIPAYQKKHRVFLLQSK